MKSIFLLLLLSVPATAAPVASPKYSVDCTLNAVARHMRISLRDDIPRPKIFFGSQTPLSQFQDAVEPQWGFRPEKFLNAFITEKNEIYLMDEAEYYEKRNRFIDDSLAHELTHYLQVRYRGVEIATADDSVESQAVAMQDWFRETYMKAGKSPCSE